MTRSRVVFRERTSDPARSSWKLGNVVTVDGREYLVRVGNLEFWKASDELTDVPAWMESIAHDVLKRFRRMKMSPDEPRDIAWCMGGAIVRFGDAYNRDLTDDEDDTFQHVFRALLAERVR